MSEHYDFHYQPTGSGAISGQQVLQQTEDAINELGDYVNDNVGGAMDVAQQALETAQNAEQDAQTALDTANSFSGAIQSAQQDASTALSTAQTAQTTASNANNTAIQASQDASSAVTTANNASGQVSTLSGTVTALGQRVTTAEGNIGQNTSDITALTTRVGTAEGNITTLQNDVSIAQGNASSAMATAGQVKQQAFVFRYSSTALVASSTNSNTLLDNTDNLKVGDKVIDSSGVLFSITAIDTQNSTFTIGTALIDLAQDSEVVHKSGDETVGGQKTFSDDLLIYNSDNSVDTPRLNIKTSKYVKGDTTNTDTMRINFFDSNGNNVASVYANKNTGGSQYLSFQVYTTDNNNANITSTINYYIAKSGDKYFIPYEDSQISLGGTVRRWKSVYATNFYYGSNNVEFSTKFVTSDTTQTISGAKTFSEDVVIGNSDTTQSSKRLVLRSYKASLSGSNSDNWGINFNAGASYAVAINAHKSTDGAQGLTYTVRTQDSNNNIFTSSYRFRVFIDGNSVLEPDVDNNVSLGRSTNRWKDCQTNLINGLEPSSLSLPSDNINDIIDISSYLSVLDGSNANTYVAPANGWISITMSNCSGIQAYITGLWGHQIVRPTAGAVRFLMPILKNLTANIAISGGTIGNARFIPCQGNV